jgi:flagellar motility protein MotE (MotC chaperone)
MSLRIRILPITIMLIGMSLAVKVADVIRGGESLAKDLFVTTVNAQDAGQPPQEALKTPAEAVKEATQPPAGSPESPVADVGEAAEKSTDAKNDLKELKALPEIKEGEVMGVSDSAIRGGAEEANKEGIKLVEKKEVMDPSKGIMTDVAPEIVDGGMGLAPGARYFSPIELEILQTLKKRRMALDEWDANVEVKENLLASVEKRVDEKLTQIESLKKELRDMIATYDTQEDAKIKSLVKIYETMKPKDAARIFDEVEMPILLLVIDKMAEKKVAPILAAMDSKKAKQLTVELAEQRRLHNNKLSGQPNPVATAPQGPTTSAPLQGAPSGR